MESQSILKIIALLGVCACFTGITIFLLKDSQSNKTEREINYMNGGGAQVMFQQNVLLRKSLNHSDKENSNNNNVQTRQTQCVHDEILKQQEELYRDFQSKNSFQHNEVDESAQGIYQLDQHDSVTHQETKNHDQIFQPIRIATDYSNIAQFPAELKGFVLNQIMPVALAFFKSTINVYPLAAPGIKIDETYQQMNCGLPKVVIPADHIVNGVANADAIFYVSGLDEPKESYLAYSANCPMTKWKLSNNRPVVSYINYNFAFLQDDFPKQEMWGLWIDTTIHEITHSLVFSKDLFPLYMLYREPIINSGGKSYIRARNVVGFAIDHFNCRSIIKVPLEDQGDSSEIGSHFERTTFGNEIMTASDGFGTVFSRFTMEVYYASGWYQPVWAKAENFYWGKNEGCPIAEGQCGLETEEFCSELNQVGCNNDYSALGSCGDRDPFANGCKYWDNVGGGSCETGTNFQKIWQSVGGNVGKGFRCWNTDVLANSSFKLGKDQRVIGGSCFESRCTNGIAEVNVKGQWYTCSSQGTQVTVDGGTITCPDQDRFCQTEAACPNKCSYKGSCSNGVCSCYPGYSGADCSN